MLYVARHTTRPEYQKIFIYRLGSRWVVGPQRNGDQDEFEKDLPLNLPVCLHKLIFENSKKSKVWLYSEKNNTHVTDPKLKWIENVKGKIRKSHKNISVYPCAVKSKFEVA